MKINILLIVTMSVLSQSCAFMNPMRGSSMEVEVEVYQGPLSKPVDMQWAELGALINTGSCYATLLKSKITEVHINLPESPEIKQVRKTKKEQLIVDKLKELTLLLPQETNIQPYSELNILIRQILDDIRKKSLLEPAKLQRLQRLTQTIGAELTMLNESCSDIYPYKDNKGTPKEWLVKVNRFAASLLAQSYHYGVWEKNDGKNPPLCAFLPVAECAVYARSMLSRSELLLKQLNGEWRELMPLSAYLAEAAPSLFTEYCLDDYGTCNLSALQTVSKVSAIKKKHRAGVMVTSDYERINTADALLNENYWQRINHVHSSGLGDVTTAFIKDDIGNWSLKSFSSDPEELLKAYQDLGLKALKEAAEFASGGGSATVTDGAISKARQLLNLSETVAYGSVGNTNSAVTNNLVSALQQDSNTALVGYKSQYEDAVDRNSVAMAALIDNYNKYAVNFCELHTQLQTEFPQHALSDINCPTDNASYITVEYANPLKEYWLGLGDEEQESSGEYPSAENRLALGSSFEQLQDSNLMIEDYEKNQLATLEKNVLYELNRYQNRLEKILSQAQ